MRNKVMVVGGGASGMMAAIVAARAGARVTILEQKEALGKKLLATGNGHCNYTNEKMDVTCFHGNSWAMNQMESFGVQETLAFFKELGIYPLSKNGYVYPASEQASSVVKALELELKRLGVQVITNAQVKKILPQEDDSFLVDVIVTKREDGPVTSGKGKKGKVAKASVVTHRESLACKAVILATGGKAASKLGSDGSGYYLSGLLGHSLVNPLPALTGIRCKEAWFEELAGVRIQALVSLWKKDASNKLSLLACDQGELQLTNYGISGIPVFQISAQTARAMDKGEAVVVSLKFHPGIQDKDYESYLSSHDPKSYGGFFPDKLLKVLRENPHALASRTLWASPVAMNDFDKAQVTCGGVPITEVKAGSMESVCCPGIYLAGELVDVDGICGGYNLQWAWTSGYLAGSHAGKR